MKLVVSCRLVVVLIRTVFLLSDPGLDDPPSNVFVLSCYYTQVRKSLLHLWVFVQDVDFLLDPLPVGWICWALCYYEWSYNISFLFLLG